MKKLSAVGSGRRCPSPLLVKKKQILSLVAHPFFDVNAFQTVIRPKLFKVILVFWVFFSENEHDDNVHNDRDVLTPDGGGLRRPAQTVF